MHVTLLETSSTCGGNPFPFTVEKRHGRGGGGGAVEGSADAAGCLFRSSEFLDAAESKPFRGACSNFMSRDFRGCPCVSALSFVLF